MIPVYEDIVEPDYDVITYPTRTYKLDTDNFRIRGYTDRLEAMKQAILLMLNTERFQYAIYSWNYGVELWDLFGEQANAAAAEAQTAIEEALMQDDRIISVSGFETSYSRGKVTMEFTVETTEGTAQIVKEVDIDV